MSHLVRMGMNMNELSIGVVGATGVVGESFLKLIEKRKFKVKELHPFASGASLGQSCRLNHRNWPIQTLSEGCFKGLDLVFFSSGDHISKKWAPQAVAQGAFAVDNSAAFRMSELLVVPEINGDLLSPKPTLIANPNCSTIQLVLALNPLKKFGLKEVRVSSYQAVSGAGKIGLSELLDQTRAAIEMTDPPEPQEFRHPIAFNCLPEIGSFNEEGYCSEEMKIINETIKILRLPQLKVSAFTVRVPTRNVHGEAVWVTLDKKLSREEFIQSLESQDGLHVHSEPTDYPHICQVNGSLDVHVGRIHQDLSDPQTWLMWVVGDNLLKGAALNGLQIAEHLYKA